MSQALNSTKYHTITPYLVVHGAAEVLAFVCAAFGGKETLKGLRPDGSIMHAEVTLGDSIIMLAEPVDEAVTMPTTLYLSVNSVAEVDTVYARALELGATSLREPADQSYGDRNAGVQDVGGNHWWISAPLADLAE